MIDFKKMWNGLAPTKPDGTPGDPKIGRLDLDFSTVAIYDFDLQQEMALNEIGFVQAVYIDNKDNVNAVSVYERTLNFDITVQARTQGWYWLPCGDPPNLRVSSTAAGTNRTVLHFINVPPPIFQWVTQAPA